MTDRSHVRVHGSNALVGTGLGQLGRHSLLDSQHDTILAPDPNGRPAVLDRLESIVDLEVLAVGGEDGVVEIVAGAY